MVNLCRLSNGGPITGLKKPVCDPKCRILKYSAKSCDFTIWIPDTHTVWYSYESGIQMVPVVGIRILETTVIDSFRYRTFYACFFVPNHTSSIKFKPVSDDTDEEIDRKSGCKAVNASWSTVFTCRVMTLVPPLRFSRILISRLIFFFLTGFRVLTTHFSLLVMLIASNTCKKQATITLQEMAVLIAYMVQKWCV